jgi:hypothetical protein
LGWRCSSSVEHLLCNCLKPPVQTPILSKKKRKIGHLLSVITLN